MKQKQSSINTLYDAIPRSQTLRIHNLGLSYLLAKSFSTLPLFFVWGGGGEWGTWGLQKIEWDTSEGWLNVTADDFLPSPLGAGDHLDAGLSKGARDLRGRRRARGAPPSRGLRCRSGGESEQAHLRSANQIEVSSSLTLKIRALRLIFRFFVVDCVFPSS